MAIQGFQLERCRDSRGCANLLQLDKGGLYELAQQFPSVYFGVVALALVNGATVPCQFNGIRVDLWSI
jgi:hypothetical protein